MELRHARIQYRTGHGKRHGRAALKAGGQTERPHSRRLLLHFGGIIHRIHHRRQRFKIAGKLGGQPTVLLHRPAIGLQVQRCLFPPVAADHILVQGILLGSQHRRSALRDALTDAATLHQQMLHTRLLQPQGAEHACQPAADHQNRRFHIPRQRRKTRRCQPLCP